MRFLDDLTEPIICASMAGAAGGALAAAVTRAGGLGTIGFTASATPELIAEQSDIAREGGPFGIGLMSWAIRDKPEVLAAAIEARPTLLSISFGDPTGLVADAQEAGITVATQVGTLDEATRALDAGVDVLIARGSEGGGHGRGEVATLPLLQQVVAMSPVPVIAAGGIGTARGVAAVLAAGAVAAWVGTPFAACAESDLAEAAKVAIIEKDAADTIYTRAFDIAQRFNWPVEYGGRALTNPFTERWGERIPDLEAAVAGDDEITDSMNAARAHADLDLAPVYAGQSTGLVAGPRTAAEVMADLAGFRSHLRQVADQWPER